MNDPCILFAFDDNINTIPEDNNNEPINLSPIDISLEHCELNDDQKASLRDLLREYRDVFAANDKELGRTSLVQHTIYTGTTKPIRQRAYRVSQAQRQVIDAHVQDLLARDLISPSTSPWSSPVVLVKKKDNTDRFCVDYRRLNALTEKDNFPLPNIVSIIDALSGAKFFSTLDMRSGYWQVELSPETRQKSAFIVESGLYEWQVMPFGLCNAPATFQRLMESVLRGLNFKSALCYIDDIVVYSPSFAQHLLDLRELFNRLRTTNIRLKPSKCLFASKTIEYLGHIISPEGVQPNPDKVKAVADFPVPKNVKGIRSFLGLANYYRRFVKDFAKIAAPLNYLTRKSVKFNWTPACQEAFDTLKQALISAPILAFPHFDKPFLLHVDASDTGIGMVLSQIQDGKEVAIAYAGRDLNPAERNYSATEKEALALVSAVKRFSPYLHNNKFTVFTDHNSLVWLLKIKDHTGRLARWSLTLQSYNFDIQHRPGIANGNADALSRRPYTNINAMDSEDTLIDKIAMSQYRDATLIPLIDYLETGKLPDNNSDARRVLLDADAYTIDEHGLLFHLYHPPYKSKKDTTLQLVIPHALRYEVLETSHDNPLSGHLGIQKTYDKIRMRYYWKGMYQDCEAWIRSCVHCAMKKTPRITRNAPILPIAVESAWQIVSMDVLGPFPTCKESKAKYILVFTDYLTRWPEAFALASTEAFVIARILVDEIVCRHGAPRTILSDRGPNFMSKLVREVCRLVNSKKLNHPQTNGLVEKN